MKGRMKPSTRFERFRNDVLEKYREKNWQSNFVEFLINKENIDDEIAVICDENDVLADNIVSPPHSLWQIFRLVNKPILLRELEVYAQATYLNFNLRHVRNMYYTAISVLIAINLIDYNFRDYEGRPSDTIQFFIKEDELNPED